VVLSSELLPAPEHEVPFFRRFWTFFVSLDFLKALQADHPEIQENKKQKNSFSLLFSDFDQGGHSLKPLTNKKPIPKQIDPKRC
jgi:hypothetical protein